MISSINATGLYGYSMQTNSYRSPVSPARPVYNHSNNYRYNLAGNTLDAASKQFLKQYDNQFQQLSQKANDLSLSNSNSIWNKLAATSSDATVATAQSNFSPKQPASYALDIEQLAQNQVNQSHELQSQNAAQAASGNIQLNINGRSFGVNVDTTGQTNQQALSRLANSINNQNTGVTAKVVTKDQKSTLQLSGNHTGTSQQFSFTGSQDIIDQFGLNQVTQNSQNAKVTVTKDNQPGSAQTIEQESNRIALDSYRLSADLQKVGKATIDIGVDAKQLSTGVADLVASYNNTIKLLNDNAAKGTGVAKQMSNLIRPPVSEKSMAAVGLTYQKDGTLSFDEKKFDSAYQANPNMVKDVVSSSYSVSSGLSLDAKNALNEKSFNLVNGSTNQSDKEIPQLNTSTEQIKFASLYSRYGAYHALNASYVGMLFNTMA